MSTCTGISAGDVIEANGLLLGLCDEKILLTVVEVAGTTVTVDATFFGVWLGTFDIDAQKLVES